MKIVAGKVSTLKTEIDTLLRDTFIDVAGLGHVEKSYGSFFLTTTAAGCLLQGNARFLGNCLPYVTVLAG